MLCKWHFSCQLIFFCAQHNVSRKTTIEIMNISKKRLGERMKVSMMAKKTQGGVLEILILPVIVYGVELQFKGVQESSDQDE